MLEINNTSSIVAQNAMSLILPSTIEDPSFLGVFTSTSALPSNPSTFSTAGIAGTGSMYGFVNGSWIYLGQYLYDAYRYLVYYNGSAFQSVSGTKWTSVFNDIASTQSLMTEFAGSNTAMTNIAASSTAMTAIAASSTAMTAIGNSTTAMSAILPNSTYKETWWASSYAVGLGLNTYAALNNSTLAGLATVSAIAGNSTAMTAIAGSSTAMTAVVASSTAMNAVAASSTAMNAIIASSTAFNTVITSSTGLTAVAASSTAMNAIVASYTAINAMTSLAVYNAIKSSSAAATAASTLISNINSGSMVLGGGTAGSSTQIGLYGLLTLLSANSGSAVTDLTTANANTLAQKIDSAFSSLETAYNISGSGITLASNQIVYVTKLVVTATAGNTSSVSNNSNVIAYLTNATGTVWANNYGLVVSGSIKVSNGLGSGSVYWVTYTPS